MDKRYVDVHVQPLNSFCIILFRNTDVKTVVKLLRDELPCRSLSTLVGHGWSFVHNPYLDIHVIKEDVCVRNHNYIVHDILSNNSETNEKLSTRRVECISNFDRLQKTLDTLSVDIFIIMVSTKYGVRDRPTT